MYVCNVCDKGLDTEDDIKKHVNIHHKEILLAIDSDVSFKSSKQKEIVCDEAKSGVESKVPYTYKDCVVLGSAKFVSSDHKEINDHLLHHFKISRKEKEVKDKKKK